MNLEDGTDIAPILGAIATSISLGIIAWQIYVTREEGRITRTYEYLKRYNDIDFINKLVTARRFLNDESRSEEEKWEFFYKKRGDIALNNTIMQVFSLFDEIAGMYNKNLISKDIVKNLHSDAFPVYYKEAEWLINRWRQQPEFKEAYEDWREMVIDMNRTIRNPQLPFLK